MEFEVTKVRKCVSQGSDEDNRSHSGNVGQKMKLGAYKNPWKDWRSRLYLASKMSPKTPPNWPIKKASPPSPSIRWETKRTALGPLASECLEQSEHHWTHTDQKLGLNLPLNIPKTGNQPTECCLTCPPLNMTRKKAEGWPFHCFLLPNSQEGI